MGRVDGKVAFITGAARGQGRNEAVHLAREGADIIGIDICEDVATVPMPLGTQQGLEETAEMVRETGREMLTSVVDVRDQEGLKAAVDAGVDRFGKLDVVVANAAVCTVQTWDKVTPQLWQDTIQINLTGVWNTCFVTAPHLIEAGGGAIIIKSSVAGLVGQPFLAPYVAAKHGVVGIMHALCNELAVHNVRVNTIHPSGVLTPMVTEEPVSIEGLLDEHPSVRGIFDNALPVTMTEPIDISNAVVYLVSDEARYVTGLEMKVDAGSTAR
jgi:SDR family mycofactocin-dependent oxidoreductase